MAATCGGACVAAQAETFKFAFTECHDLRIEGLSFYVTALMIYDSQRAIVRGNTFTYPSASRRALGGDVEEFDATG